MYVDISYHISNANTTHSTLIENFLNFAGEKMVPKFWNQFLPNGLLAILFLAYEL